jgi:hypothetical protein
LAVAASAVCALYRETLGDSLSCAKKTVFDIGAINRRHTHTHTTHTGQQREKISGPAAAAAAAAPEFDLSSV